MVEMVDQRRPGHLWALAVLYRRGHPIRGVWEALGAPSVDLPDVPLDVRRAIVRKYAPGQRETDCRWLLEAACLEPSPDPDERELLRDAAGALVGAGLEPQAAISAGEYFRQGSGNYHIFPTVAGEVMVSALGPFFMVDEGVAEESGAPVVETMRTAGFRHVGPPLAVTRFTGLDVYYFGRREVLSVGQLLFYWQD